MSYQLVRLSALSGKNATYALSGSDLVYGTIGTATSGPSLSSVKLTLDEVGAYIGDTRVFWNSAGDIITPKSTDAKIGLGTTTNPAATLDVGGTDAIVIPVGTDAQRPSAETGMIRYNTDSDQFEGYGESVWSGLGGVIDVDQDTKISAENSAGADNDELKFFTAGTERLRIFANGHISASGDITASKNLQVDGDVTTSVTSTGSFGMIKKDGLDIREHFSRNTVEAFELDENGDFIPTEKDQYMVDPKWELDENGDLQRRERELWTFDWDSYFSD